MSRQLELGNRIVGGTASVYVIGEIGINHNGDLRAALQLIEAAAWAGCDAVKFQKRTPSICVPPAQQEQLRVTPWGEMTYLQYRERVEFGSAEYETIDRHCRKLGVDWFASCWDEPSVDFVERFEPVCYKIASASLTDEALLRYMSACGRPVLLSTGMSTMDEIERAVGQLDLKRLAVLHATSSYPCAPEQLNLRMIPKLVELFDCPIGYSGHEIGVATSLAAVALGAKLIERHITLDRTLWGSDQAASLEPAELADLVEAIRTIEMSLGDGLKRIYPNEEPMRAKLRRVA